MGICNASQDTCVTSPVGCGGDSAGICHCFVTTGKASFCALDGGTPSGCTRDEECVTAKGEGAAPAKNSNGLGGMTLRVPLMRARHETQ